MLSPYLNPDKLEAGCDEAGRGCLAGPVYAAAVIFPKGIETAPALSLLNDSKQLTPRQRYRLRPVIESLALSWAVGIVTAAEIDETDILRASLLAMHRAVAQLSVRPEHLLIDGNRYRTVKQLRLTPAQSALPADYPDIPATTIIKGDATYLSIAAASVLAKTYRDDCMDALHQEYPQYQWLQNKGYPTAAHRQAIAQSGPSPYHRLSFRLLPEDDPQLSLF